VCKDIRNFLQRWCSPTATRSQLRRTINDLGYKAHNHTQTGHLIFQLGEQSFEVEPNNIQVLAQAVVETLPTLFGVNPDGASYTDNAGLLPGMCSIVQSAPYDINLLFAKMSDAMTNNIRSQSKGTEKVDSIAWATQTFVEARRLWVTLPATLTFGTLLLLYSTIFVNRENTISTSKSSALAALLYSISDDARQQFDAANKMSEAEAMSQKMRVQLSIQGGRGRLLPIHVP
jgi:hypothetical protein